MRKKFWIVESGDERNFNSTKCIEALKGETSMSAHLTKVEKKEMVDKARSIIILCLRNKIIREVVKEKISASMW